MSVKPKKHLGQHFLTDMQVARDIVNALSFSGYDQVLEIGPGMGVLTKFLLEAKRNVSVVEIDSESVEFLNQEYNTLNEILPIYEQDFLKMDFKNLFKEQIAIVGNFPYNISSQILFKVLDEKEQIPEVVGMFQKEVAERVVAPHGNKTYGILSVLIQAFYETEYLFTVHENVFNPPPKVKSGVIRLKRKTNLPDVPYKKLKSVVKTAFNLRRKKLKNAFKGYPLQEDILKHEYFDLRAEQLSVQDFLTLTKLLDYDGV